MAGWDKNLDYIQALNVERIIPGHGPLSTNRDVAAMKAYLHLFDKKAKELCAREKDVEKLTAAMLAAVPKRSGGGFIVTTNLKTRYLAGTQKSGAQGK